MAASEADRKKVALRRLGDATFSKLDKVSAELFALTYGAVVTQLIKDYEDVQATNTQLEKMCAAGLPSCRSFFRAGTVDAPSRLADCTFFRFRAGDTTSAFAWWTSFWQRPPSRNARLLLRRQM